MKKLSLKNRIKIYLRRRNGWINGGEIERLALSAGYKGSTASRECRAMASGLTSSGKPCPVILDRKEYNGSVWYRYKTQYKTITQPTVVQVGDEWVAQMITKEVVDDKA